MTELPQPLPFVARISPAQWRDDVDATLKKITTAGLRSIELELRETPVDAESALTTVARVQRAAGDHNLDLTGLILPDSEKSIGSSDDERRASAVSATTNALELASNLGIATVTISPAVIRSTDERLPGIRYEDAFRHALVELSELRYEAAKHSVRLAVRIAHGGFLTSPLDARDFVDRCNSAWIGARLNAAAVRTIGIVEDWLQTLGHRIFAIELSEPADDAAEQHSQFVRAANRFCDNAELSVSAD